MAAKGIFVKLRQNCVRGCVPLLGRNSGVGRGYCNVENPETHHNEERDQLKNQEYMGQKCLNEVKLLGYVGSDPRVLDYINKTVTHFSLATNRYFKDRTGMLNKSTTWHNILIWSVFCQEYTHKYVTKGSRVYVSGYITHKPTVEIYDGTKPTTHVVAEEIILLRRKFKPKEEETEIVA